MYCKYSKTVLDMFVVYLIIQHTEANELFHCLDMDIIESVMLFFTIIVY